MADKQRSEALVIAGQIQSNPRVNQTPKALTTLANDYFLLYAEYCVLLRKIDHGCTNANCNVCDPVEMPEPNQSKNTNKKGD